ncbi:acetyl/propionyl/methylcrotonyl-CoA carboxylase subunit alpha [Nocardioides bigeumensis]|uniref:Biotin carboxylase N-terminal domain-containing protein n=1 Tax=Nocardioides bigeumensis TaxID=433657 RepID=A0ABP5KKN5_9ACTN
MKRLLVANRAEIASRVFRTCRRLGIETVAVHSDADADLPYVAEADLAVRLPGAAPADTYLRSDLLVEAARRAGADAVHPGYGFLSEDAGFARTVTEAGLVWVGPPPESIEQMGSKVRAKRIMAAAGVPVLSAPDQPTDADLPLLVKASAGGGGRGMRIVRSLDELPGAIEEAGAEALSAFGDRTVFVEPYVEHGRHVEVQVVGFPDGVVVLGERDCSLQRRHQKVVEETPAPLLPDATRAKLHDAARSAAAAIDYRGAGTVEFLYDAAADRFFFLEMNTRLQVEHPVTELVWGVDLVELQLAVAEVSTALDHRASGDPSGHAVEVRLYAEDPADDYRPQSGVLTRFEIPEGDGIRVDAGYATGSVVSTHYDAMLAKVICHAPSREEAIRRLADTLSRARIHGVRTNRDFLVEVLRSPQFQAGGVSTSLLGSGGRSPSGSSSTTGGANVAAALALAARAGDERLVQQGIPVGWRNVPSQPQRTSFEGGVVVEWWGTRDGFAVDGLEVVSATPDRVVLEEDGVRTAYDVSIVGDAVDVDSVHGHVRLLRQPRFMDPADAVASGSLLAPMPGTVVRVAVQQGDEVAAGDPVLVLEAMKMQHTVAAPYSGTVTQLNLKSGVQVAAGEVLAVVEGS